MSPIQFKFREKEGPRTVRVASFSEHPTWEVLSARIEELYGIPAADVGISYVDTERYVDYNKSYELRKVIQKNRDEITINTNEELQAYYTTIPPVHTTPLKFSVKNIRSPQRPRPPTDILVDIDDTWTPIFSTVPLTPSRMRETEACIEEIDDEDEQNQDKGASDEDDDEGLFLGIPGREGREHEGDDEDDASSIDSILENDLPHKKPIHVNQYNNGFQKEPSFRSVSRSSSKTGSVAESRSLSSTDSTEPLVVPPAAEQPKIPSPRNSGYEFGYNSPSVQGRLVDPVQDHRPRSRSRSPASRSSYIAPREDSFDKSYRSSRPVSEHPTPIIPTIETTSPRGFPASVDMHSIPSPVPIVIPVPPIPEESFLFERTSRPAPDPPSPIIPPREVPKAAVNTATSTTTPSLTNDIASLLDALTQAFNEHPELSEGLRNIVRNASQGVYWNNATDAIQTIRDSVVSDALEARHVILNRSVIGRGDISGQAQAEAGRKIAESLGNVFRSLGTILGSDTSFAPFESGSGSATVSPAPAPAPAASQTLTAPYAQQQSGDELAVPSAGSPAPIKATPLIRGQDFPPSDGQSLSRSSSRSSSPANDADVYPNSGARVSSHRNRKNPYPTPQFLPFVWGPPPKGRTGDRNPYGPPVPVSIPAPYAYGRHRHHRSHSGTGGYPPPPGPPPPSGQYYMSPYPSSPYGYPRYPPPPPDPRMYPGGGDYNSEYGRNGYPGIGSGGYVRRSNTLPPSFTAPITPVTPGMVQSAPAPPDILRASQPPPDSSLVNAGPEAVRASPAVLPQAQSAVSIADSTTPQSSAVVVSSPKSLNDKFAELEEVKRLYKEKKEEWRLEREERRIQREKERAERHAKRQARLPTSASASVPPPRPAINAPGFPRPPPSSNVNHHKSDDDSGTERAFPPTRQGIRPAPINPNLNSSPRYHEPSTERLHKEIFDRLVTMGYTTRSYPQLNTLVPMSIGKHVMMNKGEVPDDVIIQQVLEDIFTSPITK